MDQLAGEQSTAPGHISVPDKALLCLTPANSDKQQKNKN
jgi:hypothetical protein